ncbi:MAG: hypothetical protein IT173_18185 [Acidobacteria bacterium]|nr:hypothetical protein [Acidobacteriota bacterium]
MNVDIDYPYQAQWVEYRRYWRNFWLSVLGFFPAIILFPSMAGSLGLPATVFGIDLLFIGVVFFPSSYCILHLASDTLALSALLQTVSYFGGRIHGSL